MKVWHAVLAACLLASLQSRAVTATDASAEAAQTFRPGAETLPFQAEVSRLMDIIVHSLYSNKDIFLRELISNAADALDKVRFLALTNASALGDAAAAALPLKIQLSVDKANRVLSLRDTGVGMSRDDLVSNLGTIARSGTAAFLEQMQKGGDLNLIGQFGVGFYSVYLVSDYVEVVTKKAGDKQYVWESRASGEYAISEDTGAEDLGRGTRINIHLKDGAGEYLQDSKLKELVMRYSEFISFPIELQVEKTTTKEVPVEEEKEAAGDADADTKADGVEVEEEEDKEDKVPKTRSVTETVQEWEVLNSAQALWLRPPGNVSDEEHAKFYQALTKQDSDTPLANSHFRAEGDVDFKAVLYVPSTAPPDMYDNYYTKKPRVKLYVRRVFISDSFEDLLPKWLSFLVGLVDSDSMPLNVSREMLQLHDSLKVIRKKLVRKALDMIKRLSDAETKALEGGDDDSASGGKKKSGWLGMGGSDSGEDAKTQAEAAVEKYKTFWTNFGKALKMGIIEDSANRRRMLPLLRVQTSASGGNLTTLDAYVSRMKANQSAIYYLVSTGGVEDLQRSPFVEALVERGYEVVYFTEALDEYMMGHVTEYEDKPFANVSKEDLKLDDSDSDKVREKAAAKHFKGLATWWKGVLGDKSISSVRVSRRLASTPCVVVSGKYGWSATMERIARAQALGDGDKGGFMRGQRTLEVNPRHPLVRQLRERWEADPGDEALAGNARLLFEICLMESGFMLDDVKHHSKRVLQLLSQDMGVADLAVVPLSEEEYPEEGEAGGSDDEPAPGGAGGMGDLRGMEGLNALNADDMSKEELMERVQAEMAKAGMKDMKDEL